MFNDQELTTSTGDGTYGTEDGRDIVVAAGVVDTITDTTGRGRRRGGPAGTEAITAAVTAALAPVTKRLDEMEATFKRPYPLRHVPAARYNRPTPRTRPSPRLPTTLASRP